MSHHIFHQLLHDAMQRGYVAAFRILNNQDEAHEACQEAAMRAWTHRARYDKSKPFYPWFYRILKNYCLDQLRQRGRFLPEESAPMSTQASAFSSAPNSAESQLMEQEQDQALLQAIATLPDDLREMIELRHFQDLSYEEIAEVLDCPTGTVMSRLYRARKTLRKQLRQDPSFSFDPATTR